MNNLNKRLQSLSMVWIAVGFSCDMQKSRRSSLRAISQFFNLSFRVFISLIFVSHVSFAGEEVIIPDVPVRPTPSQTTVVTPTPQVVIQPTTVTPGPQSNYGTGQYYQNAPCPFTQTSIDVTSRGQRIKDQAAEIARRLAVANRLAEEIQNDKVFRACKTSVNEVIRKVCGDPNNEWQGEQAIDEFESHMRGSLLISNRVNYLRSYQVVYEGIMDSKLISPNRAIADIGIEISADDDELRIDTPIVPSSFGCQQYVLDNGAIDRKMCFQTNEVGPTIKKNCSSCLNSSGAYPRGLYPTKFTEYYNLMQDAAKLEKEHKVALARAACVELHIDGAAATGPDANAFRLCMQTADPFATAADYCLYCDAAGQIPAQESAFSWSKWGPGLLTALGVIGLGAYAFNQVQKTREGNWEAGYPTDDRGPAVMATYALGGAGLVVNTLQASGAFGCAAQMAAGQAGVVTAPVGLGGMVQSIFGGNINANIGGAAGYPGSMLGGNAGIVSGGVFNGNPTAGPWGVQGNMQGNVAAQAAALEQARLNLQRAQQQNQQQLESLNALANLQATLQGLEAQNLRTNQQIAEIQAQAAGISAGLNGYGNSYGGVNGGAGILGQTGAGLRLGLDFDLNAGLTGGGNGMVGTPFVPGTQYPPYGYQRDNYVDRTNYDYNNNGRYNNGFNDPYYNDRNYNNGYNDPYYNNNNGIPNYSRSSGGSNYNYNGRNDNSGMAVPSLGL